VGVVVVWFYDFVVVLCLVVLFEWCGFTSGVLIRCYVSISFAVFGLKSVWWLCCIGVKRKDNKKDV
jgi:hypothetical protein